MAREARHTEAPTPPTRGKEIAGIFLLALSLFIGLSVVCQQLGARRLMGPGGAVVGLLVYGLLGVGSYALAFWLARAAIACLRGRALELRPSRLGLYFAALASAGVLVHLGFAGYRLEGHSPGGLVGEYGAELLSAGLGTIGTLLVGLTGLAISLVATTSWTVAGATATLRRLLGRVGSASERAALAVFPETPAPAPAPPLPAREMQRAQTVLLPQSEAPAASPLALDPEPASDSVPIIVTPPRSQAVVVETPAASPAPAAAPIAAPAPAAAPASAVVASVVPAPALPVPETQAAPPAKRRRARREEPEAQAVPALVTGADATQKNGEGIVPLAVAPEDERTEACAPPASEPPAIIAPRHGRPAPRTPAPPAARDYIQLGDGDFQLPELALLDDGDTRAGELDRQAMLDLAARLERTLADYGVRGRVSEIHPGPVVTMYEFVPQAGTKLSKITALASDLAMALEALRVRIVAPIPGKAAVGIEVPNRVRETVYLKEILGDEGFLGARSQLTLALGKDIAGRPISVDLAKMPHLLVAGTTGSGKSVSVNGMICSLLFKASPDDVKLLMIDPKMLELSIYEGIPHLLLPVVTDPKKANLALRWAVDEMERRYDLISKAGVRDIASYNRKLERELAGPGLGGDTLPVRIPGAAAVSGELVDELSQRRAALEQADAATQHERPRKLPYIVIVIDEFADLMMVASKEVETSVARLAQKARAAGIHLLIATQRPSVDVITGLIKANFPSRIAFQVASKIDARTILDQQGAENLLGMGDMLLMDRGAALQRVHGALVTDTEIHRVVESLKQQGKPVYDLDILRPRGDDEEEDEAEEWADEMYDQAVALVAETRQASISMIQRRLRIGYNRAARMVERMEREGIVGPADGARPREVLVAHHAA